MKRQPRAKQKHEGEDTERSRDLLAQDMEL